MTVQVCSDLVIGVKRSKYNVTIYITLGEKPLFARAKMVLAMQSRMISTSGEKG